ncbi:MAG: NYN domain-containing protein [Rhodospirillales bacterium]|jgi:uncharacterized LabA/DUF88 family protein
MQSVRRGIFIDGANLFAAAKHLGFDIDYRRLLDFFGGGSWLVRAYYYTAIAEDQEYSPVRPLADWLDYNGYTLISKSAKEFVDASGRRRIRGNMDVEITVDALSLSENLDHVILMSGNGDFRRLIEAIQQKGVRVTVVSTVRTNPPMIADELRRQADEYIDLLDIAPRIERRVPDRGEATRAAPRREEKFDRPEVDDQPLRGPGDFRDAGYLDDDEVD